MFLLVEKHTKRIVLSSARPMSGDATDDGRMYIVEIPDGEYSPEMVGGILHDD